MKRQCWYHNEVFKVIQSIKGLALLALKTLYIMKNRIKKGIYERMQHFSDLTLKLVLDGRMQRTAKCLAAAENLFVTGTVQTRNAITVVYIYHLAAVLESHYYDVKSLLPESLRKEYLRINSFGL